MPKNYLKSEIKQPLNRFVFLNKRINIGTALLQFQKFVYTVQLGEQRFGYEGANLPTWVSNPKKFTAMNGQINDFFSNLLDSNVSIDFQKDNTPLVKQNIFGTHNFKFLSVFSGGIDSASLPFHDDYRSKPGLLHHTITHKIPLGKAKKLFYKYFKNMLKVQLISSMADNNVKNPGYLKTRGLIFLTNALCVAAEFNVKEVVIPENGPFMINLGVSSQAEPTRTTDLEMLHVWTMIFNKITNSNVEIKTPFRTLTKSEVILASGNRAIINDTWSCSYFQGKSKMCGVCNACLVRILSCYAIDEGENIENSYELNTFLIEFAKLGTTNKNSYRISLESAKFWAKIIDPSLAITEIEKLKFESINILYPVMVNHSIDMMLGFQKLSKKYHSKESLFLEFSNQLDKVDSERLKIRSYFLYKKKMAHEGWK